MESLPGWVVLQWKIIYRSGLYLFLVSTVVISVSSFLASWLSGSGAFVLRSSGVVVLWSCGPLVLWSFPGLFQMLFFAVYPASS